MLLVALWRWRREWWGGGWFNLPEFQVLNPRSHHHHPTSPPHFDLEPEPGLLQGYVAVPPFPFPAPGCEGEADGESWEHCPKLPLIDIASETPVAILSLPLADNSPTLPKPSHWSTSPPNYFRKPPFLTIVCSPVPGPCYVFFFHQTEESNPHRYGSILMKWKIKPKDLITVEDFSLFGDNVFPDKGDRFSWQVFVPGNQPLAWLSLWLTTLKATDGWK
ncbi:uncharacterized protein LOC132393562 isoform X2 [Hypanus sabinus]|uniref:uncharacterized protein LOC132393562 isoform X2 n=1 Tax=Hypanus sabinus TaxID=79690 RepID=UPI0028C41797|nr:uncharacterized protein LOC132393562 isoform X2 [Hypanus sabinus]XP_059824970.1 uncharacterized protein LOC132393562 isoform X2 [Hypanus sabinus]